jgi:hypothetical protein
MTIKQKLSNEPPDKANKVLNDLKDLFKPILAKLSKDQRKTLAEIDQHIFPLQNSSAETIELDSSTLQNFEPVIYGQESEVKTLDNLFCISLNNKIQAQKKEYDEELYS